MTNRITDYHGKVVLTAIGIPVNGDDNLVCVGLYDPGDEHPDPDPLLLLAPRMALALADALADEVAEAAQRMRGIGKEHDPTADATDHRCAAVTGRLMLARITDDHDAFTLATDDVGDCVGCWQRIASQLLGIATHEAIENHGQDGAISMAERFIGHALDAVDADEEERP